MSIPRQTTLESMSDQGQRHHAEGLSLHSGVWTRFMLFLLRIFPGWLSEWLVSPVAAVIYLLAGEQRRGVYSNLLALFPADGPLIAWLRGGRVFVNFGLTYVDRLWHLHFQQPVQWEPHGQEHLDALKEEPGGALVFTIHSGNYDIGTSAFAENLGRELHIVRVAEREESLQEMRAGELGRIHPKLHVHYNRSDAQLGLLLCNLLREGKVVAVQGDRVLREVSSIPAVLGGLEFKLPRGPFVLAEMTRMPCYPIFLRRVGRLRYAIDISPPLTARGEVITQELLGQRWLAVLHPFLRQHWDQWFVFESLLTRTL